MSDVANTEMFAAWDGPEGDSWSRDWQVFDRSIASYNAELFAAASIAADAHVLDIGCGNGATSRLAARIAVDGWVLGADLSSKMLARAREQADVEGIGNLDLVQADAQVHDFGASAFDVAISRFGVMFFNDPVAAFSNVRRALRPGGRLAFVAWRGLDGKEWASLLRSTLALGRELPSPPPGAPGPYAFADDGYVRGLLGDAGFDEVRITPVEHGFDLGAVDAAWAFVRDLGMVRSLLDGVSDEQRTQALDALRALIDAHDTPDGVRLPSAAWVVAAKAP